MFPKPCNRLTLPADVDGCVNRGMAWRVSSHAIRCIYLLSSSFVSGVDRIEHTRQAQALALCGRPLVIGVAGDQRNRHRRL